MKNPEKTPKLSTRPAFREYAERIYERQFGQLSTRQQGLALSRFYVTEIHNRVATYISDEDLDDATVDGSNDVGVDLIHRDDNSVLIVQAKYYKDGSGPDLNEILHFQSILDRIEDTAFKKNDRLLDKLDEIEVANDAFNFKFICLGRIVGQAKEQTSKALSLPPRFAEIQDRITVEYLDEAALTDELRNALSQSAGLPGRHELVTTG
jgi:hypothetical protein